MKRPTIRYRVLYVLESESDPERYLSSYEIAALLPSSSPAVIRSELARLADDRLVVRRERPKRGRGRGGYEYRLSLRGLNHLRDVEASR